MTHHHEELDDNDNPSGEDTQRVASATRLNLLVTRYATSN